VPATHNKKIDLIYANDINAYYKKVDELVYVE